MAGGSPSVAGDNPIETPDEDLLGRRDLASAFARHVLELDFSRGLVVGVLGPWGSGKTSFINLSIPDLESESTAIVEFNPWMFSGAEQLVQSFFVEIASQLKLKPGLTGIGDDLQDYGDAFAGLGWLPVVGPWIERGRGLSKIGAKVLKKNREGTTERREKLRKELLELEKPIVVVVDDMDRLTTTEIREVFKLVRLTANFPNVIYIAALDRRRVENALEEHGISGRDYLEKILQVAIDLPAIPQSVLNRQIFEAIDQAIEDIEPKAPFTEDEWSDVFIEVIRPLIGNMRDVRRFAASVRGTLDSLDGRVELVDVLALEAIRVFLPDVFALLPATVPALTETQEAGYGSSRDDSHLKEAIDGLIAAAGSQAAVVKSGIDRLFPAAQRHTGGSNYGSNWRKQWVRERRVAHDQVLRLYLERVVGSDLRAFIDAETAWSLIGEQEEFDRILKTHDSGRLQDVIAALENYEAEFDATHAVSGTVVLLNISQSLPERQTGMFELDTRMVVSRVIYRLLKALPDEAAVKASVDEILPQLASLSARLEVLGTVGHREGRGHKLIAKAEAQSLEKEWRQQVRNASVDDLLKEGDLLRVCYLVQTESAQDEDAIVLDNDPRLSAALIAGSRSDTRTQSSGSRTIRRSPRLAWDVLIEIFGGEQGAKERIESLEASEGLIDKELLALARKYLDGWRPELL